MDEKNKWHIDVNNKYITEYEVDFWRISFVHVKFTWIILWNKNTIYSDEYNLEVLLLIGLTNF